MVLKWNISRKNTFNDKIKQVTQIYDEVDRQIASLKKATGITCKPGCGHCCENPHVYTTVLEVLPIAKKLWKSGKATQILERLDTMDALSHCIFYQPSHITGNGHCSIYKHRMLICRLFGFSAKRNKYNKSMFVTCSSIKKIYPHIIEQLNSESNTIPLPSISELSRKLSCIDPYQGSEQLHINQAIKISLEKAGFMLQLQYHNRLGSKFIRLYNTIRYGMLRLYKQLELAIFGRFRIKRGF